jgi:hypothetical protein
VLPVRCSHGALFMALSFAECLSIAASIPGAAHVWRLKVTARAQFGIQKLRTSRSPVCGGRHLRNLKHYHGTWPFMQATA